VSLDDLSGDIQPKTGPGRRCGVRFAAPIALVNMLDLFRRDAGTAIANA
jgi:hypothetical protein